MKKKILRSQKIYLTPSVFIFLLFNMWRFLYNFRNLYGIKIVNSVAINLNLTLANLMPIISSNHTSKKEKIVMKMCPRIEEVNHRTSLLFQANPQFSQQLVQFDTNLTQVLSEDRIYFSFIIVNSHSFAKPQFGHQLIQFDTYLTF